MPPRKKRKVVLPTRPPGILVQYLTENFSSPPNSDLLIGHVLFLFVEHDRSYQRAVQVIKDRTTEPALAITPSKLRQLVSKTIKKYTRLDRENYMKEFDAICHERFVCGPLTPTPEEGELQETENVPTASTSVPSATPPVSEIPTTPSHDPSYDQPSTSKSSLEPATSERQLRGEALTPRKAKLKKRLEFISKSKSDMRKKHLEKMKEVRLKDRKPDKVKHLNQVIKRKQAVINKLRQHQFGDMRKEIEEKTRKLIQLQRAHKRLKSYRRQSPGLSHSSDEKVNKLQEELKSRNATVRTLENEKLELEEVIESLHASTTSSSLHKKGKRFEPDMRMLVYDSIVNHVPTKHVPNLLAKFVERSGLQSVSIPHRSTVEMMCRELGVISDLQVGEMLLQNEDVTLGFDATTQEGVHINSIHITNKDKCQVASIDQLPGGTAIDYESHITNSIDQIANVYSTFHQSDYPTCRGNMIRNIANTMTDRVAVNHATIQRLEETWGKSLNELNCHLHPLETIASSSRSALKACESTKGNLFGSDCIAANIVLAINKFRYKDGKGDPKGFAAFLDEAGLPRGVIPRYRGNRLHILFHICGKLFEHHSLFFGFFKSGTVSCGGLQSAILHDFDTSMAKVEIQALGLIGKLLSGPWMALFYTSAAAATVSHIEGIEKVKAIIQSLKETGQNPRSVLTTPIDFFGNQLAERDSTLIKLRETPADEKLFDAMMQNCISAIVVVLERQYKRYFTINLTEELKKETESARLHNIDAEEVMGMFSAAKDHAPNATLCYLSSQIRAQKNRVVDYLDSMEEQRRNEVINMAVTMGRKQRQERRKQYQEIKDEISQRIKLKREKKEMLERKRIEKKLKSKDLNIAAEFTDLDSDAQSELSDILDGKVVGRRILHLWYDEDIQEKTLFHGKIEKLKKKAFGTYVIGYWTQDETYDNAIDYDMSKYALAADYIFKDLSIS